MSLRRKTLLIVGGTVALLVIVLVGISQIIVVRSFAELEERETSVQVERALAAFDGRVAALETVAGDWAPWDDTYSFLEDGNQAYIDSNLAYETLQNLAVDFMAFVRNSGEIVYVAAYDDETGEEIELPAGLRDYLRPQGTLLLHADVESSHSGLLMLREGPILVASYPILTSEHEGPIEGSLIVGRALAEAEVAALEGATRLNIDSVRVTDADPPADFVVALERLSQGEHPVVIPLNGDAISGYSVIPDIYGEPALLLRVTTGREIHQRGVTANWYVTTAVLAIGAALLLVVWLITERLVLRRLSALSGRVDEIRRGRRQSDRVTAGGSDELSLLGRGINGLLESVERSEAELVVSQQALEARVIERTRELSATNLALKAEIEGRLRTERALRSSEERLLYLVENMADAVLTLDSAGTITFANPRAVDLTEYALDELLGMHFTSLVASESTSSVERQLLAPSADQVEGTLEIVIATRSGASLPLEVSLSALVGPDSTLKGVQWIARDVSERRHFEEQLVYAATHDFLTGLANRPRFEEEVERALAQSRRLGDGGAVLWLDLDDFKGVNDAMGHRAGDRLLVDLTPRISAQLREYDLLARIGGDEFAALLPHTAAADAEAVAARILDTIRREPFAVDGHSIRVTASVGIAIFPDHGTSVTELLAHADIAMYRAKDVSRDGWCSYRPDADWHSEVGSRLTWAERIDAALTSDSLVVYAQPIVDLADGSVWSHELLVRLLDHDGSILPPGAFLHHAEQTGLIRDIDRWMVRRAVDIIAVEIQSGREIRLDVNLSAKALTDRTLLAVIREVVTGAGIPPGLLGLEITETAAATDLVHAEAFTEALRDLGCRVSLDDFGSGFSSFYYLKHLAVDTLKIDGSFVRDMKRSAQDRHLVKAMIELARGLSMSAVAEFVEDEETARLLAGFGADWGQGYYFARPRPVEDALADPHLWLPRSYEPRVSSIG